MDLDVYENCDTGTDPQQQVDDRLLTMAANAFRVYVAIGVGRTWSQWR